MSQNRKSGQTRAVDASLIFSIVLTASFYFVMYLPSMRGSILQHYTTEHIVEYVIVWLFVWGIVDIVAKLLGFPREMLALRQEWLPPRQGREPMANAQTLLQEIREKPHWLQESRVGKRLTQALDHVSEKSSAKDYREHLRYLSDQEEDAAHTNYTLIRFVIGITPVLGFLGTVIHFGTALSGISFDEMTEKLPTVVGEMGTAFNTTSVALVAAMTMMFSLFLCQRIERNIMHSIDRMVDRELLKRFEFKDPSITPFLTAVQSANEEALGAINSTLARQIEVWVAALDSVFERFDQRQGKEVQNWQQALQVIEERHQAYDADREEQLRQIFALAESRQQSQFGEIQALLERAVCLRDDFAAFMKTLDHIARGEGKLIELQDTLAENLRAIHETQQIDKALHGLTAAIHLMTARQYQGGSHAAAA